MARPDPNPDDIVIHKRPPATTPQARENQLISLAVDLAEEQIRSGKASSQVITHFLKLGTIREALEKEKLISENQLAKAKVEQMQASAKNEEIYKQALDAMRQYSGNGDPDDYNG